MIKLLSCNCFFLLSQHHRFFFKKNFAILTNLIGFFFFAAAMRRSWNLKKINIDNNEKHNKTHSLQHDSFWLLYICSSNTVSNIICFGGAGRRKKHKHLVKIFTEIVEYVRFTVAHTPVCNRRKASPQSNDITNNTFAGVEK